MPGNSEPTTKFKVDISELKKNMQEAQRQIRLANSEFKAATAGMDNWSKSADGISAKLTQLHSVLDSEKKKLSSLEAQYRAVCDEQGATSKGAQELAIKLNNQKAAVSKTEASIDKYEKSLEDVNEESDKSKKSSDTAAKGLDDVKDSADGGGKSLKDYASIAGGVAVKGVAALGAALVAVAGSFAAAVVSANNAKKALNGFQAQTGVATEKMGDYDEVMKNVYKNNFGESFDDVAEAMGRIVQNMGEMEPDKLQAITEKAIGLRDTFDMDLNESIRGIQGLMDNMGLSADEAFDFVAKGAQNGLNKSDELMDNISEYSQIWGQAGFSAEDMFSILQNGLDSGAYNLDKVNDFVKEFAISLSDGRIEKNLGSFSKGTQDVFAAWKNGKASQKDVFNSVISDLGSMTDKQAALTLASDTWSALGEDNAMAVITSLNGVNAKYKDVKGTMDEVNAVKYNTPIEAIQGVGRVLETDFVMPLGDKALPMFQKFADSISEGATKANGDIGAFAQSAMGSIGELLSTIGGKIVENAPAMIDSGLQMITNIVEGITQAMPTILQKGAEIATSIFNGIMNAVPVVVNAASEMVGKFGESLKKNLPSITGKAFDLIEGFADTLAENAPTMIKSGMKFMKDLVKGLMDSLPVLISRVPEIISKFANIINKNAPTIIKGGFDMIVTLVKGIINAIPVLVKNIPKIIKALIDVWEAFNWLNLGKMAINGIKKGVLAMVSGIKGAGKKVMEGITNIIKTLPGKLFEFGKNAIVRLANAIISMNKASAGAARNIFNAIVNVIKALPGKLLEFGKNSITKLGSALSSGLGTIKSKAGDISNAVKDKVKKLPDDLKTVGKNLVKGLWNGIKDMTGWVTGKIEGFSEDILGGIKDFFGIHSPSKVMEDVIGKNLVLGLAEGITNNAQTAIGAMTNLAGEMLSPMKTSLSGVTVNGAASSIPGTVGGNGNVNNVYNFNQVNNSPKSLSRWDIYRQTKNLLREV